MPWHSPPRFAYHVARLKNIRNWFISTHTVWRVFLFGPIHLKKDLYIQEENSITTNNPNRSKETPPSIRLFRRPSKPFPRLKTPAAYVRVPCYTPARVSNFKKDFLAGAYYWTGKESKHVLLLLEERRDYGKAVVCFLILDGAAMLCFDV